MLLFSLLKARFSRSWEGPTHSFLEFDRLSLPCWISYANHQLNFKIQARPSGPLSSIFGGVTFARIFIAVKPPVTIKKTPPASKMASFDVGSGSKAAINIKEIPAALIPSAAQTATHSAVFKLAFLPISKRTCVSGSIPTPASSISSTSLFSL